MWCLCFAGGIYVCVRHLLNFDVLESELDNQHRTPVWTRSTRVGRMLEQVLRESSEWQNVTTILEDSYMSQDFVEPFQPVAIWIFNNPTFQKEYE